MKIPHDPSEVMPENTQAKVLQTDPHTGFLSPLWSDLIAVGGAAGLLLAVISFVAAVVQLNKTKKSIDAANAASREVLENSKNKFLEYIISNSRTVLRELAAAVVARQWGIAALRASDLADQAVQISHTMAVDNDLVIKAVSRLRHWAATFHQIDANGVQWDPHLDKKWQKELLLSNALIDSNFGPFKKEASDGE